MGKYLGWFIAAVAIGPGAIVFIIFSGMFNFMFQTLPAPPEAEPLFRMFTFGFFLAGIIMAIVAGVFLIIGLVNYRNRYEEYKRY